MTEKVVCLCIGEYITFQATHLRVSLYIGSSLRVVFLADQMSHVPPGPHFPIWSQCHLPPPSRPPRSICYPSNSSPLHIQLSSAVRTNFLPWLVPPNPWRLEISKFFSLFATSTLIQPCLGKVPLLARAFQFTNHNYCEACSCSRLLLFAYPFML